MQILKSDLNIDFMGKRKLAILLSAVVLTVAAASLLVRGLTFATAHSSAREIELCRRAAM